MKKRVCKTMALALVCGLIAGCGDKVQQTPEPAKEMEKEAESPAAEVAEKENKEETVQKPAEETVNVTWYVINGGENPDKDKVVEAINAYIEPKIGVTITLITSKEEPELPLALASGEDIDLYWTASWSGGENYINDNSCLDLTDYLKDYPDLYNSIPEKIWEVAQVKGRNFFVPVYKESATGYSIAYSTDTAEKYGWDFSSVSSLEDITPFLAELYENGATNAFLPVNDTWAVDALDTFSRVGPDKIKDIVGIRRDEGKTVINMVESEEYEKFLRLMYSWNQAGYINPERVEKKSFINEEVEEFLKEGDTGFIGWTNTPDGENNASQRFGTSIGLIPISKNYLSREGTFGSAYMINSKTEKVDACLKLLGLLSTDQTFADLICYGIEGEHYTRDEEGYVTVKENPGYRTGGVWATCNVMAPSIKAGESADKKEQYGKFNEDAESIPADSFQFDKTNVEAECAAIVNVYSEYYYLMYTGFYNPDEYLPKMQKALKDAGIDKVIAEIQAQYDAYMAGN